MGRKFLLAVAAIAAASPAAAAVSVLGSSSARLCYLAAESRSKPLPDSLRECNEAITHDALSDNDLTATLVNRGILKARLGNVDEAIADYDLALRNDPNEAEAYLNKGFALLNRTDAAQQAVPMFDSALAKRTRKPALAYYGRAMANELTGRAAAAYHDYREASRIDPKWREPKADLARFRVE
ncbi:MAG: tetratricopeptide repeat protein [Allosphingosinicella sp.]